MRGDTAASPVIYLKPGEMHLSAEPSRVTTVLGSCVSVTMFSPRLGVGAISHVMLPKCKCRGHCEEGCIYYFHGGCQRNCADGFKYADCSMAAMLAKLRNLGIGNDELEIKLFGGSDMFSPDGGKDNVINIGKQNIAAAMKIIEEEGLSLVTYDVGGTHGRKIIFYTHTGDILLKRLNGGEEGGRQ